jgi:hypothetical protein
MRGIAAIGLGILAAAVLVAQIAVAQPASPEMGHVLAHRQVLQVALARAKRAGDPHPKRIEMASGPLKDAMSVSDPTSGLGPAVDGEELVDLVVMHGWFHVNGSPPRGRHIAPGRVLEVIVDAHSGFVQGLSLGNRLPVSLSRLGEVTRLR